MDAIFNILVIAFIGLIAYWWANQGILSALLHLICVVAAGALAFAGWEPIGYILLGVPALVHYAWGIALLFPFALYLFILRTIADKLAPDNLNFPHVANLGLGGVLGALAGVLTVGISIIGAGHIHSSNEILGVVGVARTSQSKGQPNLNVQPLWVPAHTITARTFEFLSSTSMRPTLSTPTLASEQPFLDKMAIGLFRDTYLKDGRIGRVSAAPGAVRIDQAALASTAGQSRYIVKVHLEPGATTAGVGFALSASQFRLVGKPRAAGGPGSGIAFPTEWSQPLPSGGTGIFKFDDRSHYVTGPAGTQTLDIVLMFPADAFPKGEPPRFLQTMGLRLPFPAIGQEVSEAEAAALVMGAETGTAPEIPSDTPEISQIDLVVNDQLMPASADTNSLPTGMGVKDGNWLFEGVGDFEQGGFRGNKNVVVKGIWSPAATRVVRLNMSRGGSSSIDLWNDRSKVAEKAGPSAKLTLIDDLGRKYFPIGYMHITKSGDRRVTIALNRQDKYTTLDQFPSLSSSGADTLYALFTPAVGRTIVGVKLGDEWVARSGVVIEERK
jgi:hypothetical protein